MTFSMSKQILQSAHLDYKLSVHLAGVNDLIAAEGKYHLICLRAYERSTSKNGKGMRGHRLSILMAMRRTQEWGRAGSYISTNGCVE